MTSWNSVSHIAAREVWGQSCVCMCVCVCVWRLRNCRTPHPCDAKSQHERGSDASRIHNTSLSTPPEIHTHTYTHTQTKRHRHVRVPWSQMNKQRKQKRPPLLIWQAITAEYENTEINFPRYGNQNHLTIRTQCSLLNQLIFISRQQQGKKDR